MTTNRGNQHNGISTEFLQACYVSGDSMLAKKVAASVRKDLQQQMRYYKSLGENMTDDQLANNAYMVLQGKGGNLSDKQLQFAQDIFTTLPHAAANIRMGEAIWSKHVNTGN